MDYSYNYYETTSNSNLLAGIGIGTYLIVLTISIFMLVAVWKLYKKAGQPGWAAIIPIYNMIIMLKVVKLDWWHIFIWLFIPLASIVYGIIIPIRLAKAFGKDIGFGILAIFIPVVAYPILAFGSSSYEN